MRRALMIVVVLLLAGGIYAWYAALQDKAVKKIQDVAKEVVQDVAKDVVKEVGKDVVGEGLDPEDLNVKAEVDVDLSLKGIELSHGKEGQLHWKLTAKRAQYLQDQGVVEVTEPKISYHFVDDNKTLEVVAAQGRIEQQNERARLWPEVTAEYGENTLRADELEYEGERRELILSGNVQLMGPKLNCYAARMRYMLKTNDIIVEDGVKAQFILDPWESNSIGAGAP